MHRLNLQNLGMLDCLSFSGRRVHGLRALFGVIGVTFEVIWEVLGVIWCTCGSILGSFWCHQGHFCHHGGATLIQSTIWPVTWASLGGQIDCQGWPNVVKV